GEQLRKGDVDGALEQARSGLDELRSLRDSVQQRREDNPRQAGMMTPQERARMELMRELSRIQDDEVGLRSETRGLHQQWRQQAAQQRQAGLRARAQQLLDGPDASELSEAGKQALRAAMDGMQSSGGSLEQRRGGPAIEAQSETIGALQRALDSLRDSS